MMTYFISFMTIFLMIVFLGIWAWAWSRHNKAKFAEAAQLPLQEDDEFLDNPQSKTASSANSQEK